MSKLNKEIDNTVNEKFLEVLEGKKWERTENIVEMLDSVPGFWENIMFLESVKAEWKKTFVRKKIKQIKNESGFPLFASVKTKDENGETVRVYKREDAFTEIDFLKAAEYHGNTSAYHGKMARHYAQGYKDLTGKQIMLPFKDDAFID